MMTFLPFANFADSAACLDMRRLQNQRTEARFVLEWLNKSGPYFDLSDYGAARMWSGFRDALAMYYNAMLAEYERRGKKNGPTLPRASVAADVVMPPWMGDARFHSSHRAVLLQKDATYYGRYGWAETELERAEFREYLYPHPMADGRWGLYPQSKYKKRTIVAIAHGDRIDGLEDKVAKTKAPKIAAKEQKPAEKQEVDEEEDLPLSVRASARKRKVRESTAIADVCATPSTAAALSAPNTAHATLTAEYTQLTKTELPRLAAERSYPIRFDHCFQRVALDHAFGGCWYEHLDRKTGPAIKQIGTEALARAVAACRRMAVEGVGAVRELDEQSLLWRGKQPKAAKRRA